MCLEGLGVGGRFLSVVSRGGAGSVKALRGPRDRLRRSSPSRIFYRPRPFTILDSAPRHKTAPRISCHFRHLLLSVSRFEAGWVRDWEGGTVLGGRFCFGRVLWSRVFPGHVYRPDVITLLVRNRPPGLYKSGGIWA